MLPQIFLEVPSARYRLGPKAPAYFKRTLPSVRGASNPPSLLRSLHRLMNFDTIPIGFALRLILRPRLTLIR
jgi:hypothetical protein